jgi:gamma-glutamyl hercynylcysteine S-oxide synthase
VTTQLAARGVSVLWPYLDWDQGTRAEGGADQDTMASLLKATGGRGINGDSEPFVNISFWQAGQALNLSLALQAEGGTRDNALNWSATGWGYWGRQSNPGDAPGYNWTYEEPPLVDRFKYVTAGEYTTGLCDRYDKNRTSLIQMSWFNGDAYVSWENVWGAFNKVTERDGELMRRFSAMARFWGEYGFMSSQEWEPYAPVTDTYEDGLYASRWPFNSNTLGGPATLWTIIVRGGRNLTAVHVRLNLTSVPLLTSHVYDCYHGRALLPAVDGTVVLDSLESGALGCIVALPRPAPPCVQDHLRAMANMTSRSVASFDPTWYMMEMSLVPTAPTPKPAAGSTPVGMVLVPRVPQFRFQSQTVAIENEDSVGGGEQYPWESAPHKAHDKILDLGPFWIHQHLVTNADFKGFLLNTSYSPRDPTNFLKNWNLSYWDSLKDLPVTWISFAEAKAYCKWSGGRLPHSYEWQLSGQGTDNRVYPWGNNSDMDRLPPVCDLREGCGPDPVGEHPTAASPYGVEDMLGNVWQFTADEFMDDHTRRVVLRGGSNYHPTDPTGDGWYFPQAKSLVTHNTLLLMDDSFERAATVGVRCVIDA